MMRWQISIEAWPYSTGAGQEADQKAAGDRTRFFYVDADDIHAALRMAKCFAEGMQSNPAIWQAPIMGVHRYRERTGVEPTSNTDELR